MNTETRRQNAGIRFLLTGLSLALAINLAVPRPVSAGLIATVLYAAPTAVGSGDCSSWANACTLKTALANANPLNQIWVKKGVHKPGALPFDSFLLKPYVTLYGGFNGTESSLDQQDWKHNITVLSGDIDGNDIVDSNGVTITIVGINNYHVVMADASSGPLYLDGFVITGGLANGTGVNVNGGGMYLENNNTVSENSVLENVIFSGNSANLSGGGMYNDASSPLLQNVIFQDNITTNGRGGGMVNVGLSNSTLVNVLFIGNQALNGGGMGNLESSPTLTNVTFSGNSASANGGGIHNSLSSPTLVNVILWGNTATSSGAQVYNSSSAPAFSYSDIQGCGGSGGWVAACGTDGGVNIDANPLFLSSSDLRLQAGSPAINSGNNSAPGLSGVTTDLAGNPRISGGVVDMGAYELQWLFLPLARRN